MMQKNFRNKSILEIIDMFGSQAELARYLGVSRHRVYEWEKGIVPVPLPHAIRMEDESKGRITVDHLTSKLPKTRRSLRRLIQRGEQDSDFVLFHDIQKQNPDVLWVRLTLEESQPVPDRDIILDGQYHIISGIYQLRHYLNTSRHKIPARVFKLGDLLEKGLTAKDLYYLLISEKALLGLALWGFVGNRQGQRTDLCKKNEKNGQLVTNWAQVKKNGKDSQLPPNLAEVKKSDRKTRSIIAAILGFSPTTFERAIKVVLYGTNELINAMDQGLIAISKAAKLAELSPEKQISELQKICPELFEEMSQ